MKRNESLRYLAVAVLAAREAGRIQLKNLGKLGLGDVKYKGESDWVTKIDARAEKAVIRIIKKAFPAHTIKAEESAPHAEAGEHQWIIDPIDGTTNYIHSFPMFCTSIALARNSVLEVGVIYDPLRRELFTARRGHGAFLNGKRSRANA